MSPGPLQAQTKVNKGTKRAAFAATLVLIAVVLVILYLSGEKSAMTVVQGQGLMLEPIAVIDGPGEGETPRFDQPLGVAISEDGLVFVADSGNNRIAVFDRDGDFIREWGGFGLTKPVPGVAATWAPGKLNYPTGIDVGEDGLVYVADFHNDQISVFRPDGTFVRAFPEPSGVTGRGGSGKDGRGIAVTDVSQSGGYVVAADTYQVFVFTPSGTLVRQFGRPGGGLLDIDHPTGISLANGMVFVSDTNHQRVLAFNLLGEPVWSAGVGGSRGATENVSFGLPRGIAPAGQRHVLVADPVNQTLVLLDTSGRKAGEVGRRGTAPGLFNFPTDVDTLGNLIAVADKENDRVQIMRLIGVDELE